MHVLYEWLQGRGCIQSVHLKTVARSAMFDRKFHATTFSQTNGHAYQLSHLYIA